MGESITQAIAVLFPEHGRRISNVKFYLGSRREVTADELASEIVRVEAAIATGQHQPVEDIDGDLQD